MTAQQEREQELLQRLQAMEQECIQWTRTNVARALATGDAMMQMAEGAGSVTRAVALRVQGTCLRLQGQVTDALAVLQRSQRLFRQAGEDLQWARTVTTTIPVWVQLDRHKQAIRASEAALKLFLDRGENAAAARLLNNMGSLYGSMGRPNAALRCFTRGEELARQSNNAGLRARFNQNRALVLEQLGRHNQALPACARALRYWRKTGEQVAAARALQVAAVALFHLGRFGKALRRFASARATFETASAPRDVVVCDLYIAACYLELNRHDQTLTRVQAVLERIDPVTAGFQFAWAKLYEGVALARLGRRQSAHASLAQAHDWFKRYNHSAWAGKAQLEEADALLGEGSPLAAMSAARTAARLFKSADMRVEEARAHLLLAEGALQTRRAKAAEAAANLAYPVFRRSHMPGPLFRSLHLLGRIALKRRQWESARRFLIRAVTTAERMRATVQVSFRRAFLDDKSSAYADLVWLHLAQGRVGTAHQLADRAKSRALVDALSVLPNHGTRNVSPRDLPLLAEIESVRREYQGLSASAPLSPEVAAVLRAGSTPLTTRRAQLEQRLAALWDAWELRQTASIAPAGGKTSVDRRVTRVPEGACMVEYFATGARVLAFVSDRRGLRGWVDLGPLEPVRQALELLQLNLDTALHMTATHTLCPPGLAHNADALLHLLHQRVWQPLLPLLGTRRRVIVIPHGILHLVPYEALYDGERYLVEQVELSLAPSRAAWVRCLERGGRAPSKYDLVMGFDPEGALPFVEAEVRQVAASLGTEPHLGAAATTQRLAEAGQCRIVHVAVHGEFRHDNPFFSTLLLADGPLTVADGAGLRLDASLVVLSGCETGLSRITRGEELMGMISAFLQAGAATVLASRWRVDDRVTAELMQRFYDGLLAGRTKAASLREAQAALAARRIHPLYWAAFGLVGDGGLL